MDYQIGSAEAKFGMRTDAAPGADPSPTFGLTVGGRDDTPWWHPDHAMFWFASIAAAAVGLMGVSVHGRVGPLHATAGAGKG
jgi:hypothetical protein